jgi:hypothetical protein
VDDSDDQDDESNEEEEADDDEESEGADGPAPAGILTQVFLVVTAQISCLFIFACIQADSDLYHSGRRNKRIQK